MDLLYELKGLIIKGLVFRKVRIVAVRLRLINKDIIRDR